MWANEDPIDINKININIYKGTEEQNPDNTMYSLDKATPAYRGLWYVVITDFPLVNYDNKLPTFIFEISCVKKYSENKSINSIKAISIGPGFGEFTYDTIVQNKISVYKYFDKLNEKGGFTPINSNSNTEKADAILSLNNLYNNFPKLKWISIAIAWFTNSTNCSSCKIYPTVEYKNNFITAPNKWQVANFTRKNAKLAFTDSNNELIYGGTVSDKSLINLLNEIKKRNYKIMLYPIIYVENLQKQKSDETTGTNDDIVNFFLIIQIM